MTIANDRMHVGMRLRRWAHAIGRWQAKQVLGHAEKELAHEAMQLLNLLASILYQDKGDTFK